MGHPGNRVVFFTLKSGLVKQFFLALRKYSNTKLYEPYEN